MFRARLLVVAVAMTFASVASVAPTAGAQEPGVAYDEDSPAGKEYAIPLDRARREAAGSGTTSGGSSTPAPTFGEGIRPAPEAETNSPATDGDDDPKSTAPSRTKPTGKPDDDDPASDPSGARATATPESKTLRRADAQLQASIATAGSGGTRSGLLIAGGAAGLALLGGVAARGLRRRRT